MCTQARSRLDFVSNFWWDVGFQAWYLAHRACRRRQRNSVKRPVGTSPRRKQIQNPAHDQGKAIANWAFSMVLDITDEAAKYLSEGLEL